VVEFAGSRPGFEHDQEHRISVTLAVDQDRVKLHFEDDGVAFDPRQPVQAAVKAPPDSDSGGRGLVLLRSVAERIDYERTPDQRNHLRVTVALPGPNPAP
jgi:anti-sigma regulatory factor (Ser/Thr protein kinase)